jgi:hypothetical protein
LVQSTDLDHIVRAEKTIRNTLGAAMHELPRPTNAEAEAEADEFDGSVPFSQWLERDSKSRCGGCRFSRSVKQCALTVCITAACVVLI